MFDTSMKTPLALALCSCLLLSGCDDKPTAQSATESADKTENMATLDALPADAPALGTDIKDMVEKPAESAKADSSTDANITKIMWEDLVPDAYKPETIMAKYQSQVDAIEEGSEEELALFTKIKSEFNNAPTDASLAGKTVKIPGFVSPLDENNGMVGEFLLVPYFGSCIHSPPPPINQTVLVKPQAGKSIAMADIYQPVWVTGEIKVEPVTTDLAQAGYQIENARLERYEPGSELVN